MLPREEWHFQTDRIGRRVLVFDQVESTNTLAAELAASDQSIDGLVIIAEHQTAGRGRFGRVWQARPGCSLLMSVVLTPPVELRRASILTAWAAVAVGEAILDLTGLQARIKWPNDLLIRGKKVCGILIEQSRAVIVGIGLNLNQTAADFEAAGLPDATSLVILGGQDSPRRAAAAAAARHLDREYQRLLGGERIAVEADWKWRTGLLGRHVLVELTDGGTMAGRMMDMSFDGLEIDTGGGRLQRIIPESVGHVWEASADSRSQ
jgi:BirA family biotin operon repressor/biotin-[acetyl-CoA-carboxylase] ligase